MNSLILFLLALASLASGITTDLLPTDDSFIRFGNAYAATNYGALTYLEIEETPVRADNSRETFLKYDISSIQGTITAAQLVVTPTGDSPALNIDVSVQPDNWNERTVCANNQPTVGALAGNIGANGIGNLNIGALQSVWGDKIISFQLWDSRKTSQLFKVVSKEGGNPAKLRITYTPTTTTSTTTTTTTTTTGSATTGSSSTTGAAPSTINFSPIEDAYVRGGASAGQNFGTDGALAVKAVTGSTEWNRDSYIKFNLNSLTQPIKTAQLVVKAQAGSAALNFDVAVVTNDGWAESTINWNNKPASGAVVGHVGNDGIATLSVGDLNAANGDKILTLRLFDSGAKDSLMNIYSKEGGVTVAPVLKITV